MNKPIDLEKLRKDAEVTLENSQERKKADRWEPMSVSLDGMITYCENVIGLCEIIKEKDQTIKERDNQIEYLKTHEKPNYDNQSNNT